jgi:hypothetical protein
MPGWRSPKLSLVTYFFLAVALAAPQSAFAWGDEGHQIIALIVEHYLDPAARAKVATLLAADADTLTDHDIVSEATWADKYRDSDRNTTKIRYEATWRWHFVDIELAEPNLASACFGHPPLPVGIPASEGPPRACVVDKIDQFATEISNPAIIASEQLLALKFLLHSSATCFSRCTQPTITTPAGTRSVSRLKGFVPATFTTTGDKGL